MNMTRGGICKLMTSYQDDIKGYSRAPISNKPVIILIDNDSGANSIYEDGARLYDY